MALEDRANAVWATYQRAQAAAGQKQIREALEVLRPLANQEPLFVPGLLLTGACLQLLDEPTESDESARKGLERAGALLRQAVQVSGRSPEALSDLGHFVNAIEDAPDRAAGYLLEAAERSTRITIDALQGLFSCREQLGRTRLGADGWTRLRRQIRELGSWMDQIEALPEED